MQPRDSLIDRLLSHRLRGFDERDSTRLGLERALKTGVRNAEFDVRLTRDGYPIAYHDPFFKADNGTWGYIEEWDLDALRSQRAFSSLATLEDMCRCFAEFGKSDAFLHVDVKVGGCEAVIRDTIAKFGVPSNTVLVSWLPEVLVRFHAMSPATRLCFSHLPLARTPWLYGALKTISPLAQQFAPTFGKWVGDLFPVFAHETLTVRLHFHDDGDVTTNAGDDDARATPGHVVPGVLTGVMLELLRKTGGMVCVPLTLADRKLREDYRSLGVQFAVYSVADMASLESTIEKIDPDIVYVDSAEVIERVAQISRDGALEGQTSPLLRAAPAGSQAASRHAG